MRDPWAAAIARSTCASLDELLHLAVTAVLGTQLAPRAGPRAAVCGDALTAARLLAHFTLAAWIGVVPLTVYGWLEWRLKARFAARRARAALAYGPWGWPVAAAHPAGGGAARDAAGSGGISSAGAGMTWLLLTAATAALSLVWNAMLLVVPALPAPPCAPTCVDAGDCPAIAPPPGGGLLAHDPGLAAALTLLGEVLGALVIKLVWVASLQPWTGSTTGGDLTA